ncbi:MAG: hypothetical protein KJO18_05510 [Acidimicrobiia bacterium]|nr:hypothetical protein [Acidimicrobiia bacterium]
MSVKVNKEINMRKRIIPVVMLVAVGAGVTAYAAATARSERPDCPGKIVCPLTDELVCKDRCPLGEQAAADQTTELPACCRERK